jgi:hypothetical protein
MTLLSPHIRPSSAARTAGAFLAVLLLTAACSERASVVPVFASPALTKSALNLENPPSNRARVIVFNGGNTAAAEYQPRAWAVSIFVNGTKIGNLDPRQAMVFDVAPGQYSFHWTEISGKALLHKIEPLTVTLQAGAVTPLQADSAGAMTLTIKQGFGPYQLTNQGGRQQIQPNIEIVRPQFCPPTLCLPLD